MINQAIAQQTKRCDNALCKSNCFYVPNITGKHTFAQSVDTNFISGLTQDSEAATRVAFDDPFP
jgi:hypothetical protein